MIKLSNVTFGYEENQTVLKNYNLLINKGEFVTILGHNGSGKSTLSKLLVGLVKANEGEIYVDNQLLDEESVYDIRQKIGIVFQNYALYPHMTVRENILFPLKNLKWDKQEAEKRVVEVAKIVKIADQLDKKPSQLSGGQQQRVAIARALAKKPEILLLDEPLSNLDTKLRVETRQEIRRIQKETGVTAIFVTHDQEEAMCISDEIVLMKDGAIQQVSSPTDIYMNPVNKFVASFIGSPEMNFIDIDLKDGVGNLDTLTIENLPKNKNKVILGVRAEDFEVAEKGLQTKVVTVEILGRERLLTLDHKGKEYKMLVDKEFFIDEGADLTIRPKNGKSYVFDSESEEFIAKC